MSEFDPTLHPRGNPGHAGQFAAKVQTPPKSQLDGASDSVRYAASALAEISSTIGDPRARQVEFSFQSDDGEGSYAPSAVYDAGGRPLPDAIAQLRCSPTALPAARANLDSYEVLADLAEIGQLTESDDGEYFYFDIPRRAPRT